MVREGLWQTCSVHVSLYAYETLNHTLIIIHRLPITLYETSRTKKDEVVNSKDIVFFYPLSS